MIPNTPEAWRQLEQQTAAACAPLNDHQLTNAVSALQYLWRQHREPEQWAQLQALYTEQHRRRHA